MRILIVTPWFPSDGAVESGIFVAREALALAALHEVSIIHIDANGAVGEPLSVAGARVTRVRLNRRSPRSMLQVRHRVEQEAQNADIVHTHALTGLLPWLRGRPGRPWIHTEHWSGLPAPETLTAVERLMRLVLRPVLKRPELVIAECERLAGAVRKARRGPVEIVPCIVPAVRKVTDAPRGDVLRLVAVGGLIPRKGPHLALDAVAELRARGVDVHLTWIGGGPLRDELEFRVAQEGLEEQVSLLGTLPPAEVSIALDASDLFLLPTQGDNFCVVTAEALVHGRPIISGASTGAVDYTPTEVGEFVSEQTGRAYADAVEGLRDRTADIGAERISHMVRDRFQPDTIARQLTTLYGRVLSE